VNLLVGGKVAKMADNTHVPGEQSEKLQALEAARLQIEKQSLSKEDDEASRERLEKLEGELSELSSERDSMKLQWMNEKESIDKSRKLKEQLEGKRFEQEKYMREGNLEKAAELKYSVIPNLEKALEESVEEDKKRQENPERESLLRQEVTEEDIATRAVMETNGILALYDNEPILTLYSSTAGGYTESYSNAFSDTQTKAFPAAPKPYLAAVPDKDDFEPLSEEEKAKEFYSSKVPSFDIDSPYYRWQKEWAVGELENILKKTLVAQSKTGFVNPAFREGDTLGKIKDIKVMKRGESGKVMELDIMTSKTCYRVSKELVIRRVFQKDGISLPSANVIFEKKLDNMGNITDITAYGGGFGHGVGMSQFGAGYMATKLGQPYYNILRHYYKGISLGTKPIEIGYKEFEQTFWAPLGRAHIVIVGASVPKLNVMINGKTRELNVNRGFFQKETKIDISRYIEDGQNKILFYPTYFPMKVYIELVESYNTNTNKTLLEEEED